jgi:hypothetical protein
MSDPKKVVGLMVQRVMRHGTEYVDVSVMVREDDADCPYGMPHWYAYDGKPFLDGLCMRGSVHVPYQDSGPPVFYADGALFYDVYSIGLAQSKAMTATLTKVGKQVERDNAHEPGDVFLALARAVGAQWVCVPHRDRYKGGAWRDTSWIWYGLTDGRNMYRSVIEGALREAREAQADRLKPVEPVAPDLAWHAPASSEAAE